MAYDKNINYQDEINKAVARGDYASASRLEKSRNEKIDGEGLDFAKTNNYTMPNGMNGEQYNKINSSFKADDNYKDLKAKEDYDYNWYKAHTMDDMISSSTDEAMNKKFAKSSAIREADAWLAQQLKIIQSGKTSYSDQVRDMMDKIMNREKFSYDVDEDPLFQQALSSAMKSGHQAMTDTIGQASALTGGYGSTYATTAGNQAYNAFIEDAYNNLPEYYKMAREAYDKDGEEMFRQFGVVSELDDKEYNRNLAAYDATYQHRNAMYNEEYGEYRDEKSDAFAMADLEMRQYGQKSTDFYNLYAMSADRADKEYERQYKTWADEVNKALELSKMGQADYWNQYGYDWETEQNKLKMEHESSENALNRSHESSEKALDRAQQDKWNQKNLDYNYAALAQDNAQFYASLNKKSSGGGGGGKKTGLKAPTESQMKKALEAYNSGGTEAYSQYLNSLSDSYDKSAIEDYVAEFGRLDYSLRTYTVVDDGGWNLGWGVDNNAVVKDNYSNKFTLKDLAEYDEDIAKELSKPDYTKGKSYTKPKKK